MPMVNHKDAIGTLKRQDKPVYFGSDDSDNDSSVQAEETLSYSQGDGPCPHMSGSFSSPGSASSDSTFHKDVGKAPQGLDMKDRFSEPVPIIDDATSVSVPPIPDFPICSPVTQRPEHPAMVKNVHSNPIEIPGMNTANKDTAKSTSSLDDVWGKSDGTKFSFTKPHEISKTQNKKMESVETTIDEATEDTEDTSCASSDGDDTTDEPKKALTPEENAKAFRAFQDKWSMILNEKQVPFLFSRYPHLTPENSAKRNVKGWVRALMRQSKTKQHAERTKSVVQRGPPLLNLTGTRRLASNQTGSRGPLQVMMLLPCALVVYFLLKRVFLKTRQ